jgi:hypothetical protein
MLVNRLNVFNLALMQLGKDPVVDVNTHTVELAKLRAVEQMALESLLQSHRWDFAIQKQELTFVQDLLNEEFIKLYSIPNNCIEIWRVYDVEGEDLDYSKDSRGLATSSDRVFIEYTFLQTDYGKYDATFCEALAMRIAALAAPSVQHSDSKTDYISSTGQKKQAVAASKAVGRSQRNWEQNTTWLRNRNNY